VIFAHLSKVFIDVYRFNSMNSFNLYKFSGIFKCFLHFKTNDVFRTHRDISKTEDFRKRYLYLLKVVDKICYLRPTWIILHNSKLFEQNGLLLKGRLVNRNWPF
jgi:hypothetical protein